MVPCIRQTPHPAQLGDAGHHPREFDDPVPVCGRIWLTWIEKSLSCVARRKCQEPPKGSHTTCRSCCTVGMDSARSLVPLIHACGDCNGSESINLEIFLLNVAKQPVQGGWKTRLLSRSNLCNVVYRTGSRVSHALHRAWLNGLPWALSHLSSVQTP
jgi:hypothetical protein